MIEQIDKVRRIHNLQVNFLKKLCDGQAGKLQKGFMIWRTMPQVKDKVKINTATTFATNLSQILVKNLKYSIKVFQANRKLGVDKRYQSIYRLVSNKCIEMRKYYHQWL